MMEESRAVVLNLASQQPAVVGGANAAVAAARREDAGLLLRGWLSDDPRSWGVSRGLCCGWAAATVRSEGEGEKKGGKVRDDG